MARQGVVSPVRRFRRGTPVTFAVMVLLVTASASASVTEPDTASSAKILGDGLSLKVEGIRVGRTEGRFRIVFDLSGVPDYRVLALDAPSRLVIDLHDADLVTPPKGLMFRSSPVQRFRHASRAGGDLRVVLDLASGDAKWDVFKLAPYAGRGNRLVVDLYHAPGSTPVASMPTAQEQNEADSSGVSDVKTVGGAEETIERTPSSRPALKENTPLVAERVEWVAQTDRRGGDLKAGRSSATARTAAAAPGWWPPDLSFGGTLEQEWAWAPEPEKHQKFETLVTPRLDVALGAAVDLTAIVQLRLDAIGDLGPAAGQPLNYSDLTAPWYNSERTSLSLRELYFDFRTGDLAWRLGKQQVVWGQADGIKVLDVVNPQSFREFILDDFDNSRIPLWMANLTHPVGESATLQLLWIPDTTYHELPDLGSPFAFRTPRLVPPLPISVVGSTSKPDDPLNDSDFGMSLSGFARGWDFSVNYLYRYLDTPVLPVSLRPDGLFEVGPEYRRSHLLGGTFSTAVGSMTLRGEVAWSSDTYQPLGEFRASAVAESAELSSVLGLDWSPSVNTLVSAQFFNSTLFDHDEAMARDADEQLVTLLFQQDLANAAWRFRAIGLHSLNDGDSLLQFKLRYWLSSRLELWIGADFFSGDRLGLFGQYDDEDRLLFGFEVGF